MSSTISRLKSTDSLSQWAQKINSIVDTVEGFLTTSGSILSGNTVNYIAAYSGSAWVGYPVAGDLTESIFSSQLSFVLSNSAITGKSAVVGATGFSPTADYLLLWNAGTNSLMKINPYLIALLKPTT